MSQPKSPSPSSASPPSAAGAASAAVAPKKSSGIRLLRGSLPRVVGYGMLALFTLDVVQAFQGYRFLAPESDSSLVLQLVERVGVPLVAYALIFATDIETASRRERTVLKLLSISALVGVLAYLILGALAAASAYRLVGIGTLNIDRQARERVAALELALKQVPTATVPQLFNAYRNLLTNIPADAPVPSREEMVAAIDKGLPAMIQSARDGAAAARSTLRKNQFGFAAKYSIGALLSAILFLVIWENTRAARGHRIFSAKSAPSMKIEDKLAGGFSKMQTSMEDAFFLSSLEKYRWYRKLRRFFGGRR